MPPRAEFLNHDLKRFGAEVEPVFFGGRWAMGLGGALLLLFMVTVAIRWLGADASFRREAILQQPVSPEVSSAATAPRSVETAPDPGDN